ncbi:MAG: hypothetical protein LBO04_07395 [Spirochaetaceae bacterium]|jgi:hypothetical protein|nr:hypothetical protein [Spirochaetaceae bacterium]
MRETCEKLADDFIAVCRIAGIDLKRQDIVIENLGPGEEHRKLRDLPKGKMAVYVFEKAPETILKTGKVYKNSPSRYKYHHYNPASSNSNLASSLLNDSKYNKKFDDSNTGEWIKDNTRRINFIIPASKGVFTLNLFEAFLHAKLQPRYEGFENQR